MTFVIFYPHLMDYVKGHDVLVHTDDGIRLIHVQCNKTGKITIVNVFALSVLFLVAKEFRILFRMLHECVFQVKYRPPFAHSCDVFIYSPVFE